MVARINIGRSIGRALNYNEQKLQRSDALLLHSSGYAKDTEKLGFPDKLGHLQKLAELNTATKLNSVHISLNFDPSENPSLTPEKLAAIADAYMDKIGFGDQPYLVYQHLDAGHPHIHIVSTNIRRDGKRIPMHNIGRRLSEPARKKIEQEFGLVRAEGHRQALDYQLKPIHAEKIQYGKSETKRTITNVLDAVLGQYKYSSLPELNAILKSYNVMADQGGEGSRIYQKGGLVFRILNDKREKLGVPVKASDIYSRPTLKALQEKFEQNATLKQPFKQRVKNALDFALAGRISSVADLQRALQKENIQLVTRQNDEGLIYGLTYIDRKNKVVFNGSELGKKYSAKAIQDALRPFDKKIGQSLQNKEGDKIKNEASPLKNEKNVQQEPEPAGHDKAAVANTAGLLEELTRQERASGTTLHDERKRRKKIRI